MKLKYSVFVFCYLAQLGEIRAPGTMGPLGKIVLESVYECTGKYVPKGDEMKLKVDLKNLDDNRGKALNLVYENKIALDDNTNYILDIKKFENGGWKIFYNVKGKPCSDFNRYFKKLWDKITGAAQPRPMMNCPLPPGTYKIKDFQAATNDLEVKSIFYGRLKVNMTIFKGDKMIFCVMGEGDSQAS